MNVKVPRTCNCTNFNWEPTGEPTEWGKLITERQDLSFEIMKAESRCKLNPTPEKLAVIEAMRELHAELGKELANLK